MCVSTMQTRRVQGLKNGPWTRGNVIVSSYLRCSGMAARDNDMQLVVGDKRMARTCDQKSFITSYRAGSFRLFMLSMAAQSLLLLRLLSPRSPIATRQARYVSLKSCLPPDPASLRAATTAADNHVQCPRDLPCRSRSKSSPRPRRSCA